MQTASGNRGAAVYTSNRLDYDIDDLQTLVNNATAYNSLPSRQDTGMFTKYASINIRDQMRPDDLTPLQFRYEASDCRVYYTPRNFYNMSQLWRDVAAATWNNTKLCVPDSTNYSKRTNKEHKAPPKRSDDVPIRYGVSDSPLDYPLEVSLNTSVGLLDLRSPPNFNKFGRCAEDDGCGVNLVCVRFDTTCSAPGDTPLKLCLEGCNNLQNNGCEIFNSRLAQSTAQRPVAKRVVPPVVPLRKPVNPPAHLSQGSTLPPQVSTGTLAGNVYNGYVRPGFIKTSDYLPNAGCKYI
jgi:hypothetical protein